MYGQANENGVIGQVVGDNKTQFYVSDVKESNTSEFVEISIIFKNLANGPQEFSPSVRLIDTESREYEPKSGSGFSFSPVQIPPDDILAWKASFNVVTPTNISKIYFTPGGSIYFTPGKSESRFTVDLTKTKSPVDSPPTSSWTLSSNKNIRMNNTQVEITINDESYADTTYILDLSIKNIGRSSIPYHPWYFTVKDVDNVVYGSRGMASGPSPLLGGDLLPGETVRGDVAFDVEKTAGNMMIIVDTRLSDMPFLNSGSSPIQNVSKSIS